jgi:hypothetical protein
VAIDQRIQELDTLGEMRCAKVSPSEVSKPKSEVKWHDDITQGDVDFLSPTTCQ